MANTEGVGRAENSLQLTSLDMFLERSKKNLRSFIIKSGDIAGGYLA